MEEENPIINSLREYHKSFNKYSYEVIYNLILSIDKLLKNENVKELYVEIELFITNKFLHFEKPNFYLKGEGNIYYSQQSPMWPLSTYYLSENQLFIESGSGFCLTDEQTEFVKGEIVNDLHQIESILSYYNLNVFDYKNDGNYERSIHWKKILKEDKNQNNYFYRTLLTKNNFIYVLSFFADIEVAKLEQDYKFFCATQQKEQLETSLNEKSKHQLKKI